jgi:hypothetical protein
MVGRGLELQMSIVLGVMLAYGAVGLVVGAWFVLIGVDRVDPAARGSGWWVRAVWWPGSAALWPVVLRGWVKAGAR